MEIGLSLSLTSNKGVGVPSGYRLIRIGNPSSFQGVRIGSAGASQYILIPAGA